MPQMFVRPDVGWMDLFRPAPSPRSATLSRQAPLRQRRPVCSAKASKVGAGRRAVQVERRVRVHERELVGVQCSTGAVGGVDHHGQALYVGDGLGVHQRDQGLSQTSADSPAAVTCLRHVTVSRYPGAPSQAWRFGSASHAVTRAQGPGRHLHRRDGYGTEDVQRQPTDPQRGIGCQSSMALVMSDSGGEPCWISASQLLRVASVDSKT
jgi:hypothetical protein